MATEAAPTTPRRLSEGPRPRGVVADRSFGALTLLAGLSVLIVLVLVAFVMTREAWPAFSKEGLSFVTSARWDVPKQEFGALAFVYGTVVVSTIALALAVPVSIGIALFITEVAPGPLRKPVIYTLDLMAAVPSVVFGLWGVKVFAPAVRGVYQNLANWSHPVPVLNRVFAGEPISGVSFTTAGIIVALMITPIITSLTREVFATVPSAQKEAALALGATRWEMIRGAVFPHSRSGIVAAVIIGLGRAMGETIAIALVIGSSAHITSQIFSGGDALPARIANEFGESTGDHRAALVGLGVVLFVITIAVSMVARAYVARSTRRHGGVA